MTDHSAEDEIALPANAGTEESGDAPLATQQVEDSASPLTTERVLDIAFGAIAVAADATGKAVQRLGEQAKTLQDNAPAILEALEERGRPIRQQILGKMRDNLNQPQSGVPTGDDSGGASDADGEAASGAASNEIAALEQRVRELEQQVSVAPDEPAPPPEANSAELLLSHDNAPEVSPERTPAEESTYVPHPENGPALADSEYAVSETEEEAWREDKEPPAKESGEAD